jgi:hypothetical protein
MAVMFDGSQVIAGRGLLRWSRERLAVETGLAVRTLQRIESTDGIPPVRAKTLVAIEKPLARHGVKLTPGGVTRDHIAA